MSDEIVYYCLSEFKFVSGWLVTKKLLERLHDALFANDDVLSCDEDFGNVTFFAN